jgi:hypothetical protein
MPGLCGKCVCIHPMECHPHTDYHQCTKYKVRLFHFRYHPDLIRAPMCTSPILSYKESKTDNLNPNDQVVK